jgi:hypothetical protein
LPLTADILNESYPPMILVNSQIFRTLLACQAGICIDSLPHQLPLSVGPLPYTSKNAAIRYFICHTAASKSRGSKASSGKYVASRF